MDLGVLRGLITLVTLLTFMGICWWAYRPGNRERFEEDGLLVFDVGEGVREKTNKSSDDEGSEA